MKIILKYNKNYNPKTYYRFIFINIEFINTFQICGINITFCNLFLQNQKKGVKMKKGCRIIDLGESTAIVCGGEQTDHKCNEDATVYETNDGERFLFNEEKRSNEWYDRHYQNVCGSSVACSICGKAAFDDINMF